MNDISEKNLLYIKGGVIRPETERKTSQQFNLLSNHYLRVNEEKEKRRLSGG
jgi:hypothetical protein